MQMTASDIARAVGHLPRNRNYNYVNPTTRTVVTIEGVDLPEGPIYIKRFDPARGETRKDATVETLSVHMIWRIANALIPGHPINFDRVLGGSYNTRSAFEALLAHTPQFYSCLPGRIEVVASSTEIKRGHKHLVWQPDMPHPEGVLHHIDTEVVISEAPGGDIVYEALVVPEPDPGIDVALQRRHATIQFALLTIGVQLGSRVWIAQNDKGIVYQNQRLGEMPGVIPMLRDEKILVAYGEAAKAAMFIDCIWFRNSRFMPAVIEIEHTTGVTSGLSRMLAFHNQLPPINTRWVIAAPDEDREKVMTEANKSQFRPLDAWYFRYSAVDELYGLCQRRHLKGVNDEFLDCFMEKCISA